ncbi:hypothetical protein AZE42_13237, partial [Rhizopogon vesiculosus]
KVRKYIENLVPRLRPTHAVLAIPADASNLNNDFGVNYLVEEGIIGKSVKYINNNQAVPAHGLDSKEADVGSFLCFVQHVQYQLSNEMVYLSDFQGAGDLLTDCQVITDSDFMNNFGEGNCTTSFKNFPSEHQCNDFCCAFGLQPLVPAIPVLSTEMLDRDAGCY